MDVIANTIYRYEKAYFGFNKYSLNKVIRRYNL